MHRKVFHSKHEQLLMGEDAILNREDRDEVNLQIKLDQLTDQTLHAGRISRASAQEELAVINEQLNNHMKKWMADLSGSAATIPTSSYYLQSSATASARRFQDSPSTRPPSGAHFPSVREEGPKSSKKGPVLSPSSKFNIGFPTPYEDSGFSSVIRWADVSYQEALVTALGPRADNGKVRQEELPHRLLVSVSCYLLNEVLTRHPSLSSLWNHLRVSIFDAIFSPQLIATHLQQEQARLSSQRGDNCPKNGCAKLMFPDEEQNDGDFHHCSDSGNVDRCNPKLCSDAAKQNEPGIGCMLSVRQANYTSVCDFANYRLWTEEFVTTKKDNERLTQRITELKEVVCKSRLVLNMAKRRIETSRKSYVFLAWRNYAAQARAFRRSATRYIICTRRRMQEESCFLRWRRMTVQSKIGVLKEQLMQVNISFQNFIRKSELSIGDLREKLTAETKAKREVMYKDEALRSQMLESHSLETDVLKEMVAQQRGRLDAAMNRSRRWERLAKTFRPRAMCLRPNKAILRLGVRLRQAEDNLVGLSAASCTVGINKAREALTAFLLAWVNFVMQQATAGQAWIPIQNLSQDGRKDVLNESRWSNKMCTLASDDHKTAGGDGSVQQTDGEGSRVLDAHTFLRLVRTLRTQYHDHPRSGRPARKNTDSSTTKEAEHKSDPFSLEGICASSMSHNVDPVLQVTLLHELCDLMYLQTNEGLLPSLLMHSLPSDILGFPSSGGRSPHSTSTLWILSALFVGYVHHHCSAESFFPTTYAECFRCHEEDKLRTRLSRALLPGEMDPRSTNVAGGSTSIALAEEHPKQSYVIAAHTALPKQSANVDKSVHKERADGALVPPRVTSMEEIELVQNGVDTVSDMDIYLGRVEESNSCDDDSDDADALVEKVVAATDRYDLQHAAGGEGGKLGSVQGKSSVRHCGDKSSSVVIRHENPGELSGSECDDDSIDVEIWSREARTEAARLHQQKHDERDAIIHLQSPPQDLLTARQLILLENFPPPSTKFFHVAMPGQGDILQKTDGRNNSRTPMHTFLNAFLVDSERRQQWLGLSRLVTSLVTRFRILDGAVLMSGPLKHPRASLGLASLSSWWSHTDEHTATPYHLSMQEPKKSRPPSISGNSALHPVREMKATRGRRQTGTSNPVSSTRQRTEPRGDNSQGCDMSDRSGTHTASAWTMSDGGMHQRPPLAGSKRDAGSPASSCPLTSLKDQGALPSLRRHSHGDTKTDSSPRLAATVSVSDAIAEASLKEQGAVRQCTGKSYYTAAQNRSTPQHLSSTASFRVGGCVNCSEPSSHGPCVCTFELSDTPRCPVYSFPRDLDPSIVSVPPTATSSRQKHRFNIQTGRSI